MARRPQSQPTTARRGVAEGGGRDQGLDLDQQRPRALDAGEDRRARGDAASRSARNRAEGLATSARPALGHLEDADLVGRAEAVLDRAQDAELVAALALEVEHGVDHVLEHARAGDLAVLGDVADQHHGDAARLAKADQLVGGGAHLGDRAGRAVERVDPHGLDRIDDDQRRAARPSSVVEDVARRWSRLASWTAASAEAEAAGAQADLVDRLLAGDVDDRGGRRAAKAAAACSSRVDLPMPGSPPTRIAEPGTMPPPSDAVELVDAGERRAAAAARSPASVAELDAPAAGRAERRPAGPSASAGLLDDAVPGAAGVAAAGPFRRGRRRRLWQTKRAGVFAIGRARAPRSGKAAEMRPPQGRAGCGPDRIRIGPSARPWMNWSTIGVAAVVDLLRPGPAR